MLLILDSNLRIFKITCNIALPYFQNPPHGDYCLICMNEKKRQGMTWCVVRDEVESRSGWWSEISQSAVGVCPSGGLLMGVGRQRASWKASMSRHALPCALLCSLPRRRFASHFFRTVYTYAILYCFSIDKVWWNLEERLWLFTIEGNGDIHYKCREHIFPLPTPVLETGCATQSFITSQPVALCRCR